MWVERMNKEHNPHKCTIKGNFINNSCTPKTTGVISYRQICLKQNQAIKLIFHKTNYQMH